MALLLPLLLPHVPLPLRPLTYPHMQCVQLGRCGWGVRIARLPQASYPCGNFSDTSS